MSLPHNPEDQGDRSRQPKQSSKPRILNTSDSGTDFFYDR